MMKDDIWPNPLQYYLNSELEPVSGNLDDDDDDEDEEDYEDEEEILDEVGVVVSHTPSGIL